MRSFTSTILALLLATAITAPGPALALDSLWNSAIDAPDDQLPEICRQIIAHQNDSKLEALEASMLLFEGRLNKGGPCVEKDYVRSFELMQISGNRDGYSINLKILRQRAAAGEKLAIAALPLIPKWKD